MTPNPTADIGLIGLGVMGANLALNIAEKGFPVAVYNRTADKTRTFAKEAGDLAPRIIPCETLEALVAAIRPPRAIIIMIKAGAPVDEEIAKLQPLLAKGDCIIDAGNANFRDTMRRFDALAASGLNFIGMGVSGGEEGARHGPSIMAGGDTAAWGSVEKILTTIAAQYKGEACCALAGPNGAGHFVKTIHNGIEYADMEMIAEIYGLMRDGLGLSARDIGEQFLKWNDGPLDSYLIEITAKVLQTSDAKTGKPLVDIILDQAGQKGTGKWAAMEAQDLAVPATTIEAAVAARVISALKGEREIAAKTFALDELPVDKAAFSADLLERALMAGKIAAYAQGFAVMATASKTFSWNLPLDVIAKIWRAGCIIRSQLLDRMAEAFTKNPDAPNLLMAPDFSTLMRADHKALRTVVAAAVRAGLPVPALSNAIAWFDGYRQTRGTTNLIQGQRDFFGAHGFERLDAPGVEAHGPWHHESSEKA